MADPDLSNYLASKSAEIDALYESFREQLNKQIFAVSAEDAARPIPRLTLRQRLRWIINSFRERLAHWIWPYGWEE